MLSSAVGKERRALDSGCESFFRSGNRSGDPILGDTSHLPWRLSVGNAHVDVVIAATSSAETLLYRDDVERLMEARRHRPSLIDLAVPRNIDPAGRGLSMSLDRI